MQINRTRWYVGAGAPVYLRNDVFLTPFNFVSQDLHLTVSGTGDQAFTFKVFGQTVTFTTTFATTGQYVIKVGCVLRRTSNGSNIIMFPPTYYIKGTGTAPTNGMLPTATAAIAAVNVPTSVTGVCECTPGSGPHPIKLNSVICPTPGCINWLVAPDSTTWGTAPTGATGGPGVHTDGTVDAVPCGSIHTTTPTTAITAPSSEFGALGGATAALAQSGVDVWGPGQRRIVPRPNIDNNPGGKFISNVDQLINATANTNMPTSFAAAGAPQNIAPDMIGD